MSKIVTIFAKYHAIFREELAGAVKRWVGGINKDFWPEYTPLLFPQFKKLCKMVPYQNLQEIIKTY